MIARVSLLPIIIIVYIFCISLFVLSIKNIAQYYSIIRDTDIENCSVATGEIEELEKIPQYTRGFSMRIFAFNIKEKKDISIEEDGWIFKVKYSNKLGLFCLESPVIKKITYSKGKAIRHYRYTIRGIGCIDDNFTFKGIAFFNFLERYLLTICFFISVSVASENICAGILFAGMAYLFDVLFSWEDDSNLRKAQKMCER